MTTFSTSLNSYRFILQRQPAGYQRYSTKNQGYPTDFSGKPYNTLGENTNYQMKLTDNSGKPVIFNVQTHNARRRHLFYQR